jgi:hypothetical protein
MLAVCEVGDRAGFEKLVAEMPRGLAGVIECVAGLHGAFTRTLL